MPFSKVNYTREEWLELFDKKPCHRKLEYLKRSSPNEGDASGKWTPNYEGVYIIKNEFSIGSIYQSSDPRLSERFSLEREILA
ncbi:hypothetical protein Lal_00039272 [Lupinus albus]|nr:hypothetical protein Lal_00039272 [Lupinus albus]